MSYLPSVSTLRNSAFNPQCFHTLRITFWAEPLMGSVSCGAGIGCLHTMYLNFRLQNDWAMVQAFSCQPLFMKIQVWPWTSHCMICGQNGTGPSPTTLVLLPPSFHQCYILIRSCQKDQHVKPGNLQKKQCSSRNLEYWKEKYFLSSQTSESLKNLERATSSPVTTPPWKS